MQSWTFASITEETKDRLSECRWHKLGGGLLFVVVTLFIQGASYLFVLCALAAGLNLRQGALTGGVALLLGMFILPILLIVTTLVLLFRRRISFRIPFAAYTLLQAINFVMNAINSGGYDSVKNGISALAFVLLFVYTLASDRVRVFFNQCPKRPVPMPAPEAAPNQAGAAYWDERGLIYTDTTGRVTNFSEAGDGKRAYRFINLPSDWRMTARRVERREETACK